MKYMIPIMKYVGGEDFEKQIGEVAASDATTAQVRRELKNYDAGFEEWMVRQTRGRNESGKLWKDIRNARRNDDRMQRYLFLVLKRKEAAS